MARRTALKRYLLAPLAAVILISTFSAAQAAAPAPTDAAAAHREAALRQTQKLDKNWAIQSSCKVQAKGPEISTAAFKATGWIPTSVPSTVFAAQVTAGIFKDPFFGMNLRQIPGVTYPIGTVFARRDMDPDSPYACSWWYRTEFTASAAQKGRHANLHFNGITYRANIWMNGKQIADKDHIVGTYRHYELPVELKTGTNVLAVEVTATAGNELGYNWVDWNPSPPDKNMGLWREVFLSYNGGVAVRNPQINSHVADDLSTASLEVSAEVRNDSDAPVEGTLRASMPGVNIEQKVTLAKGENKLVTFDPQQFKQLVIQHPKLWWPAQMGLPTLHNMKFEFVAGGKVTDESTLRFGIREVKGVLGDNDKGRLISINGRRILIRGGGWAPDMMLRFSRARLESELHYVLDMHLNAIRLEGKMENPELYDVADEYGVLVMAGWCCCDWWEQWEKWKPENFDVAYASLRSQMYELRQHPSVFLWLNGSDNPPIAEVESKYLAIEKEMNIQIPTMSSATAKVTEVTGRTGGKMSGPYDYVPPDYWMQDKILGGSFSFNTETSAGAAPLTMKSLKKTIPADHLWPIDEVWNYHAGGGEFKDIHRFTNAMTQRYGAANSAEEFATKGQAMAYENERAMYEGYSRNKYSSTGVIQWMLNNAWPGIIWHLYDYYLTPAGGYFGTKKACEPVHVAYSYDDNSIAVINSTYEPVKGLKVTARVLNFDLSEKFSKTATVDVDADGVAKPITLPNIDGLSTTYFVRLDAEDAQGKPVSNNFYWLSTKADTFDASKSTFFDSEITGWGDLTQLNSLEKVKPEVHATVEHKDGKVVVRVGLQNASTSLAFMTHLAIAKGKGGDDIAPILWSDNYVSMLPKEKRELTATFDAKELDGKTPVLEVDGWNITPGAVPLSAAAASK
ncbi:glycoside hydrolase family 2, sugar binding protein [Candidatus Koribacter versatilis Ellin345]|uniref:Glycoside hydrolase family 2, sugar binding protein n=1 Tax=Koribacter versatilis (strain Ellin345) TaxID=204669 RepID=Q1IRY9_KORVE|nr:beta galactosidase jelly roll domain-containing protein [Candidatus Koribacter versatilis]ABF40361.1 glycoside hydrolase family 2, sugar binding protein [Candidatus Koribacter versatilis Ellin345]